MRARVIAGVAAAAAAGLAAGGVAYAALYPPSQIFGRVLVAGKSAQELALTYDDGPNPAVTPLLLDLLDRHRVRATFFIIGEFVRQEQRLVREIAAAGHLIGNHSMTHPRLAWQSSTRIKEELRQTRDLIEDCIGAPVRYFRPPHGARRPFVLQTAASLGMTTVQWNVTASDWKPLGADAITRKIQVGIQRNQRRGRGSNILMHDGGHLGLGADRRDTVRATDNLLSRYTRDQFVTVDFWS